LTNKLQKHKVKVASYYATMLLATNRSIAPMGNQFMRDVQPCMQPCCIV